MRRIRPFASTDADYRGAVAVENAVWPRYPSTVAEWRHYDETRDPQYFFQRVVIEAADQIVAVGTYAETSWAHKPGKYFLRVNVHPDFRRQGIGTEFFHYARRQLADREPAPTLLTAHTREDQEGSLIFLSKLGFEPVMRFPRSQLSLADFDFDRFEPIVARVEAQGIELCSLKELQRRYPDWVPRLYELMETRIMRDVPLPDAYTPPPLAVFEERHLNGPNFMPEAIFVALDGDAWVGTTGLFSPQIFQGTLETGLTGVLRSHRRRGIATALKTRSIRFARDYGAETVETDNEENNPMYQLNLVLGFTSLPAWVDYQRPWDLDG